MLRELSNMLQDYKYPKFVNLIYNAITRVDAQIMRDYNELAKLQSNKNLPQGYYDKLVEIVGTKLIEEFEATTPRYGIIINEEIIVPSEFYERYVVINIFSGEDNLLRAVPFFSLDISIVKFKNVEKQEIEQIYAATVFNPVLDLFYWSIKEGEAFEKTLKLQGSRVDNEKQAYGIGDLKLNAPSLEACFVANARLDYVEIKYEGFFNTIAVKFIAENSGINFIKEGEKVFVSNKYISKQ
jgi:hypothetical protein